VRGSDLEEGDSQGLPVWSRHVGEPVLESNITRRVDFALFMVEALENDALVHEAPAIVGCQSPSALAHAAACAPSCLSFETGAFHARGASSPGDLQTPLLVLCASEPLARVRARNQEEVSARADSSCPMLVVYLTGAAS
jgi:hypothetical protein